MAIEVKEFVGSKPVQVSKTIKDTKKVKTTDKTKK